MSGSRQLLRIGYFTAGAPLIWECPRVTPARGGEVGEQMDFAAITKIRHGRIRNHRVFWAGAALR